MTDAEKLAMLLAEIEDLRQKCSIGSFSDDSDDPWCEGRASAFKEMDRDLNDILTNYEAS